MCDGYRFINRSYRRGRDPARWNVVGDVLMVVGAIGLVLALIYMATASRRRIVDDGYVDRADRPYVS